MTTITNNVTWLIPRMVAKANDNTWIESKHVATAGGAFHPEMGERHDGKALFIRQVGYRGYNVKWSTERHDEALAAFKTLRIRPRSMVQSTSCTTGKLYWSACLTWAAGTKLQPYSVTETLLD